MKNVRTRYAPSPTGFLHIGGARTALFSFLLAKHFGGKFILRIEDTDIKRNKDAYAEEQIKSLEWLGIIPDESPKKPNPKYGKYHQSQKIKRYKSVVDELLEKKLAYFAFETVEELALQKREQWERGIKSFRYDRNWLKISSEEKRKRIQNNSYTIRIMLPKNKVYKWHDLVRGDIATNSDEIGDFVIWKADGYPTYNLAVVVDDHDMNITHVLRGEEHISNTPKQLAIYELLNWNAPKFGHLTIITDMSGKKLSKRSGKMNNNVQELKRMGILPEAIFNYLATLGWTHFEAKEVLSYEQLIKDFDYKRLSRAPSKFDLKKLLWFSKIYIQKLSNLKLKQLLKISYGSEQWQEFFVDTFKESSETLEDFQLWLKICQDHSVKKNLKTKEKMVIINFKKELFNLDFTYPNIKNAIINVGKKMQISGKKLFMPIRQCLTYLDHGPELAKIIFLIGKDTIYKRLSIWQ